MSARLKQFPPASVDRLTTEVFFTGFWRSYTVRYCTLIYVLAIWVRSAEPTLHCSNFHVVFFLVLCPRFEVCVEQSPNSRLG